MSLRASSDDAPRQVDTVYIRFASHYVIVRADRPDMAAEIASLFGAMVESSAAGTCTGAIDVVSHADGMDLVENGISGVERFTDSASALKALADLAIQQLIAARQDLLWIHGGVMAWEGRAVLISAASGQGKSTLVDQLAARDWTYFSDEIAAIDPGTATVLPFPVTPYRRVPGPPGLSATEVQELTKVAVEVMQWAPLTTTLPLAGIYFLSYDPGGGAVEIASCSPGAAVVEMLRNSLNPRRAREQEIAGLCRLMSRVPAHHLRYADAQDAAERIVRAHLA